MKNAFNMGYFTYSDQTKMELLLAAKAFITVFCVLKYASSATIFDFNVEKAHDSSLERLNQVMAIFGGRLDLPYEFTYSLMATLASLLTFATAKLNIRFSHYFFMISKNSQAVMA